MYWGKWSEKVYTNFFIEFYFFFISASVFSGIKEINNGNDICKRMRCQNHWSWRGNYEYGRDTWFIRSHFFWFFEILSCIVLPPRHSESEASIVHPYLHHQKTQLHTPLTPTRAQGPLTRSFALIFQTHLLLLINFNGGDTIDDREWRAVKRNECQATHNENDRTLKCGEKSFH